MVAPIRSPPASVWFVVGTFKCVEFIEKHTASRLLTRLSQAPNLTYSFAISLRR
jgi:hypothetical protein